jgi:hypothetical protein
VGSAVSGVPGYNNCGEYINNEVEGVDVWCFMVLYLYLAWFHVVFSAAALRRRSKYGER